jgi:hypothetical protein
MLRKPSAMLSERSAALCERYPAGLGVRRKPLIVQGFRTDQAAPDGELWVRPGRGLCCLLCCLGDLFAAPGASGFRPGLARPRPLMRQLYLCSAVAASSR